MTSTDRAVRLLALAAGRPARSRFVEEWQADLAAARAVGLPPAQILLAVARVAAFLLGVRVRTALRRRRSGPEVLVCGVAVGLVLVVADVPLDAFAPVVLPFALLAIGVRLHRVVRGWVDRA